MSSNYIFIFSLAISGLAICVALFALIIARSARYWRNYFTREEEPENLEEIIERIVAKIKRLEDGQEQHQTELQNMAKTLATAIQHVSVVRFDSAADDGGNLSFSAAFLDAHQSGIILTSLHGRQHNRVYTKQVTEGKSEHILSDEEKEALVQAITHTK